MLNYSEKWKDIVKNIFKENHVQIEGKLSVLQEMSMNFVGVYLNLEINLYNCFLIFYNLYHIFLLFFSSN